jgi:hypothetical protein
MFVFRISNTWQTLCSDSIVSLVVLGSNVQRKRDSRQDLFEDSAGMCKDAEFRCLLSNWSSISKVTNMHVERLFALIKKAAMSTSGSKSTSVERLVSAGVLTQWLSEHVQAGGRDPRTFTRAQFVETGVPLRCAAASSSSSSKTKVHRPAGAFFIFRRQRVKDRSQEGHKLDRAAAKLEGAALSAEWADMSLVARAVYSDIAEEEFNRSQLQRVRDEAAAAQQELAPNLAGQKAGRLWDLGDNQFPLRPTVFEQIAQRGDPQQGRCSVGRSSCEPLREEFAKEMFVKDAGHSVPYDSH